MQRALAARDLGRRYGRGWGLRDCTFAVPEGRVAGLVGPNGAGTSTLLRLAASLSRPSTGGIEVFGDPVRPNSPHGFPRVGYLDQERPLYRSYTVADMLGFGRRTNRRWDAAAPRAYLDELDIPANARVRSLSVGQQAQVAMALCLGKQSDLLLLDEPAASLDPLARRRLWSVLMESVAEHGRTVLVSSHILSELEPICDFLVVLSASRVQLAGGIDEIRADHRVLIGPAGELPGAGRVVWSTATTRQVTVVVRGTVGLPRPGWQVLEPSMEEIVLASLQAGASGASGASGGGLR